MDENAAQLQVGTALISSEEEVYELTDKLAGQYVSYLDVDTSQQETQLEDTIEQCLAHLEEVCSTLDTYKQGSDELKQIADVIANKSDTLEMIYEQVDALEQYIFETNQLLEQLDQALGELKSHSNSNGNRIKQLIGYLPKLSLRIPRLFSNMGGFFEESSHSFVEADSIDHETSQIVPMGEIVDKISHIDSSLAFVTSSLLTRIRGKKTNVVPELSKSLAATNTEQVDGSWQELL